MAASADINPARAQDWSGAHNWSGAYVGLNAGYAWGQTNVEDTVAPNGKCWGICGTTFQGNTNGFTAGGQLGYNVQWGPMVFGLESDVGYLGATGKGGYILTEPTSVHTDGGFYIDGRFRAGYSFGPALIYATAGVIGADMNSHVDEPASVFYLHTGKSAFEAGGVFGGGLEYAVNDKWSVKGEYLYITLPSESVNGPFGGGAETQTFNIKNNVNIVRLGVNFHFWTPKAPVAEAAPPPAPMPAAAPAPAPVPQARTFIVFFDFDKFNLTPDARKVVEEAANAYKAGGSPKVTLAGYTDLSGSVPYNLRLSERRAKTVAAAMSKMGVPASAMDVSWHGKENPRVPTPDGVREPQNRRVEISE